MHDHYTYELHNVYSISRCQISVTSAETRRRLAPAPEFSFLTNHGKTLLLIAHDPRIRMRDIAGLLGITERRTQRIVADLAEAGYIERERDGRRNLYTVSTHLPLGLPDPARHRHRSLARDPAHTGKLSVSGRQLAGSWLIGLGVGSIALAAVRGDLAGAVFPAPARRRRVPAADALRKQMLRFPSTDLERGLDRLFALLLPIRTATSTATVRGAIAQQARLDGIEARRTALGQGAPIDRDRRL